MDGVWAAGRKQGNTYGQLTDDILDQYERHLEFVRIQQVSG
jgi:choline/glycine/proline betaine transport protein